MDGFLTALLYALEHVQSASLLRQSGLQGAAFRRAPWLADALQQSVRQTGAPGRGVALAAQARASPLGHRFEAAVTEALEPFAPNGSLDEDTISIAKLMRPVASDHK